MSGYKITIFSLNQWALDFTGNTKRIIRSIDLANENGAQYRVGPELEICGYSIEDAFFESDTEFHSWTCLIDIIKHSATMDMIVDVGLPVHNGTLYNCRAIIYKGRILCIRAKTSLANDGNYRETRHFTPWDKDTGVSPFKLPNFVADAIGQDYVPFGSNFILEVGHLSDAGRLRLGWDICQELWDIKNVSSDLYHYFGCHLVLNSSGSYWELRKLDDVLVMIRDISQRSKGCYALSNCIGCDGQRYVFSGRSCIYDKGQLVAITPTSPENFKEIQMISHIIHPREIDEARAVASMKPQKSQHHERVWNLMKPPMDISHIDHTFNVFSLEMLARHKIDNIPLAIADTSIRFEHEIHLFVSLWLWDYLRRSGMRGYMMPLSGGLDSSTVATLVYSMCNHLFLNLRESHVMEYFEKVHKIPVANLDRVLTSPKTICGLLLRCSYLSTKYSSQETYQRAKMLCEAIGAEFIDLSIHDVYTNFRSTLTTRDPNSVTLLDQNLQARLRMTATYYLSEGNRIVLATGNVDEAIMGYLTKYDCSSADINPIGGLCKNDLKSYLQYCCSVIFKSNSTFVNIVTDIIEAPPSAELTGAEQRDEDEIGITYNEISVLGKVRRGIYGCSGPKGAFEIVWRNRYKQPFKDGIRCLSRLTVEKINDGKVADSLASIIKLFYQRYARNRHKLTVLTPALHAETYSPDDNRFDHRHFLYAPWTEQFKSIDRLVKKIESGEDI